jgi:thiamine biosynthesis lipoprotein ApbE
VAVVAPTATLADSLATAFFVGGREIAEEFVNTHKEVSVLMMDMPLNGRPKPVIIGKPTPWSLPHAP